MTGHNTKEVANIFLNFFFLLSHFTPSYEHSKVIGIKVVNINANQNMKSDRIENI